MKTPVIAAALAGAIALTGFTAAPARAHDDNFRNFLGAAAAIVVIGTALNASNNRSTRTHTTTVRVQRRGVALPPPPPVAMVGPRGCLPSVRPCLR